MPPIIRRTASLAGYLVLSALVAAPWQAASVARAESKPVVVASSAGYNALFSDLQLVGELSGAPQMAQSLEGLLAFMTGMQGVAGMDKGRPVGVAVLLDDDGALRQLLFVPVTDTDRLLGAFAGFIATNEDVGDGMSHVTLRNKREFYLKTRDGWAFLSRKPDDLDDLPADPLALLDGLPERYDLAVRAYVSNVPRSYLNFVTQEMSVGGTPGLERIAGELESTHELRKELAKTLLMHVAQTIDEVEHLTIGLSVDATSRRAELDAVLTAKPETVLAKKLAAAAAGATASKFPGLADPSAVVGLHFLAPLMQEDQVALLDAVEAARKLAVRRIDESADLHTADERQATQEMASQIFDAAEATVRQGQLHGGAVMVGDGPFHVVAGALVGDASLLNGVFRRAVEIFGSKPGLPPVELGAAERSGLEYHTLSFSRFDDELRPIFGETFTVAVGFGVDRIVVAGGADPIAAAAKVLAMPTTDAKSPPAELGLRAAPLARLINDEVRKSDANLVRLLGEAEKDRIRLATAFTPSGIGLHIDVEEGILAALGKAILLGLQRR